VIRITIEESSNTICLIVEGKLSGEWVPALEAVAGRARDDRREKQLVIDLSGISGMDAAGRLLISSFRNSGVRLQNFDPLSESLLTMELEACHA
jgi:anti-anti-sigma regulatory factor